MEIDVHTTMKSPRFEMPLSNRIHLWITPYADCRLDKSLAHFRGLLTAHERVQEQKFHFPDDRRRFLVTRALLRTTLSRYVNIEAKDWRFETNAYGKPHIAHDDPFVRRLQFNLSHARGLMVLAVSDDRLVGVDTESAGRHVSHLELATRYFLPHEAADVRSTLPHVQRRRFFEYWTLKEAYVKARGEGMTIGLDQFGFRFLHGGLVDLHLESTLCDNDAKWYLWQCIIQDNYLIALCANSDSSPVVPLVEVRKVWPLDTEEALSPEIVRSSRNIAV